MRCMSDMTLSSVGRTALQEQLSKLEAKLDADVLACIGPIVPGLDDLVRQAVESLDSKTSRLVVVLDTNGGVIEVVERMVDTLRHHYKEVVFAIPDRAMSAGTIFALSGDAIMMDYFSVLGPIDPQVRNKKGQLLPAQGYVDEFDRLVELAREGKLTSAEGILLQQLDLGELQQFREAKELSIKLLQRWLVQYKFKDWTKTETNGKPVTDEMKRVRAKEIASKLSDARGWHSHGRGIPMKTLTSEALRLKIDDFGLVEGLTELLRSYLLFLLDFMRQHEWKLFVQTRKFFLGGA